MTHRLLVIRKEKLTVKQLDELKTDDEVSDIRSTLGFLVLVVKDKFKTDIEFIDIRQIFDVVVDNKVVLNDIGPEATAKFLKEASEQTGQIINFQKD